MPDSSVAPTADGLFHKWKQFVDAGALTTAFQVAADHPQLADPLDHLIDAFLAGRAADYNETLTDATDDPVPDDPAGPDPLPTIAKFTVLHRLGRGGMGEVFHVRDPLDREYALKVARRKQLSSTGRERFLAEAKAMARLNHPHVAKVLDYDTDAGGRPYFTMDLYPATLSDRWPDYRADPKAAVRLMAAVADGVGHLHSRGYVHRDLKPSNILLGDDGRPVVSDFGLVKGRSEADSSAGDSGEGESGETKPTGARRAHTVAGLVLGTRRYMAPEQAAGLNHLAGPVWDTWALGVILHELLTGQPPRSSMAPERLLAPGEPDNPPPTDVRPGLDPRLARVVRKCLARDPAERYPDGAAVATELSSWLKRGRRRGRWAAVAGVLVLALAAGATAMALPGDPEATVQPTGTLAALPDAVAEVQARLRQGDAVEVIPVAGMPAWYDLAVGKGAINLHPAADDGAMVIESGQMALMDMPPPGLDRYRFEVEVRQAHADPAARYGIYAGRYIVPGEKGDTHCILSLWFNDRPGPAGRPPEPTWILAARPHRRVSGVGGVTSELALDRGDAPAPVPGKYHTLAVEVRPERVTFFYDNQPCQEVALPLTADQSIHVAAMTGQPAGTQARFSPAGGYGLVSFGGTGVFRRAIVTALPGP